MERYDAVLSLPERRQVESVKEYTIDDCPLIPAEQKLVVEHYKLIHKVISTYFSYIPYNVPTANPAATDRKDLEQSAIIGLMKSVRTYDPEKAMFSTHAFYQIRKHIHDFILKDKVIPITPYADNQKRKLVKIRQEQEGAMGHPVSDQLAAEYAGLPYDRYTMLYNQATVYKNFDDYEQSIENIVGTSTSFTAEEAFPHDDHIDNILRESLSALSERDRDIVITYFGIIGSPKIPIEEIAAKHNISKERIRQLVQNNLKMLRHSPGLKDLKQEGIEGHDSHN